ncbi:MAG: hypothetical protein WBL85_04525 [Sedimentisphaerales bacterium]
MTDFHDNIFYYYRGPEQSQQKQISRQLENNTTKALVNTLKHCESTVAIKFLKWLGITATGKVETELQKTTIGKERIYRASQRLLLGLKATDSTSTKSKESISVNSCPDAWLYGKDFVVLIESKVGNDSFKSDQMQNHLDKLKVDALQEPRCEVRRWGQVRKFFVTILPELKDEKNKFIVEQLTQYLRWIDMTEFTGFEENIFEFFVSSKKDEYYKKLVRDTMKCFAKRILDGPTGLHAFKPSFYEKDKDEDKVGYYHPEYNHFWVAFGPTNFKKIAHQTISLSDFGLEVFVNVERKSAVDMLKEKTRSDKKTFAKIVADLPEPFSVRIEERKNKQASLHDYYPIVTLEAGTYRPPHSGPYGLKDPKSSGFDYIEGILEQMPSPYFSLRKRIDRKQVLDMSKGNGDALVETVVCLMKAFHPLVEFINKKQ